CLGLEVSLCKFFQRSFFHLCFGQQPFERGVLFLEFLQAFRLVGFHATVLVAPPIIRLLSDFQFATHISHGFAFCQEGDLLGQASGQSVPECGAYVEYSSYGPFSSKTRGLWTHTTNGPKNGVRPCPLCTL